MPAYLEQLIAQYRPMLANKLFKVATWYVIGNTLEKAIYLVGVLFFTRILVPEEYGTVSLFTTWTSIFMIVFSFNLFFALQRIYHDYDHDQVVYSDYVSSALLFGLTTIVLFIGVGMLVPETLFKTIFGLEKPYVILAGVAIFFEYPMRVIRTVWWEAYNYKSNVIYGLLLALLNIGLSVIFILLIPVLFEDEIAKEYGRAWGIIVANVCLLAFVFPNWHVIGKLRINWEHIKVMLIFSLPMIAHSLSGIALGQFDRIVIDAKLGRVATGLYSYGYQIGLIAQMIMIATNRAWSPWFMEKLKQKHFLLLAKRNQQYLIMMTVMIVVAIIVSPFAVRIIAPPQYYDATRITPIIVASTYFVFLYTMLAAYLLYEKKTRYISVGTIAAAIMNVVLNLWLIPIHGYVIAAWTTLASYVFLFAIYWFLSRRYFPKEATLFRFIPMIVYGILICIIAFIVSELS